MILDTLMSEEVKRLFELPTTEILRAVFDEAMSDEQITPEEQTLISGIEEDLKHYQSTLTKADEDKVYTEGEIKELETALKSILMNSLRRAQQDRKVTKDEEAIIMTLVKKVEDIITEKLKLLADSA